MLSASISDKPRALAPSSVTVQSALHLLLGCSSNSIARCSYRPSRCRAGGHAAEGSLVAPQLCGVTARHTLKLTPVQLWLLVSILVIIAFVLVIPLWRLQQPFIQPFIQPIVL